MFTVGIDKPEAAYKYYYNGNQLDPVKWLSSIIRPCHEENPNYCNYCKGYCGLVNGVFVLDYRHA